MRKWGTALVLAVMLAVGAVSALAAEPDGATTVLADTGAIYAAVTGYDPAGEWGPEFTLWLENRTGQALRFELAMVSADGRMCDVSWSTSVLAGESAESRMIWDRAALDAAGINYIGQAEAILRAYDGEEHREVFSDRVRWSAPTGGEQGPAVEERTFAGDFTRTELMAGTFCAEAVDYDPAGGTAGGPALTLRLQNDSEQDVYFTAADATVNGVPCDPWWGRLVSAGMTAYSVMEWEPEELESSGVDRVQTVELLLRAVDPASGMVLAAAESPARLSLGGYDPVPTPEPTPEPVRVRELDPAVYGAAEGGVYTNEYFGFVCTLPEGWMFYTDEQMRLLRSVAMDSLDDGVSSGEKDALGQAVENSYIMTAASRDGMQNINMGVLYLPDAGGYSTEDALTDAALEQLRLTGNWEEADMERTTCLLAGKERPCLRVRYTDTTLGISIPVYICLTYIIRDDYAMQITMSSLAAENGLDGLTDFFRAEQPE